MSSPVHRRTSSIHAVLLPEKTFSFYFTLNCSQNHAITSSFPVAVLREFPRCLFCSKMPFSSGVSRIHVLVFHSVQLILSIRGHTHISKAVSIVSHRNSYRSQQRIVYCEKQLLKRVVVVTVSRISYKHVAWPR